MPRDFKQLAGAIAFAAISSTAWAMQPMAPEEAAVTVETFAFYISRQFYDQERGQEISDDLHTALQAGEFAAITDGDVLASELTRRLSAHDRHFSVNFIGRDAVEDAMNADGGEPSTNPDAQMRRENFGFSSVEILPGNIGYLDLQFFWPIDAAAPTATAALEFLGNSNAIIIDLRRNNGGSPSMVQFLASYFLDPAEPVLLNTFLSRRDEQPRQLWSLASHPAGNRPDIPVIILTSGNTGSAAEGLAYHMQALQRATIIGTTTAGAGNPGGLFLTDEGFSIFIATAGSRNPITGTNWEGTGVVPDIPTGSSDALDRALNFLYQELAGDTTEPSDLREIEWAQELLLAQSGQAAQPGPRDLRRYAGDFGNRNFRIEGSELVYQRSGGDAITLIPLGNHRFALPDDSRSRFVFTIDGRGNATALEIVRSSGGGSSYPRS
jgi:hypothetical protein